MSVTPDTTLFRARVPVKRLKKVEKILSRLGIKPGDAFNMLLAQIELRKGLPFDVTSQVPSMLSADEQADAWTEAMGAY
jgi:antitoxin component of RelBE/YafQ-DinJ toxin-antitoxin module